MFLSFGHGEERRSVAMVQCVFVLSEQVRREHRAETSLDTEQTQQLNIHAVTFTCQGHRNQSPRYSVRRSKTQKKPKEMTSFHKSHEGT